MIRRTLETYIRKYSREYPVIAVVGPRQSGKTTLARHVFPGHKYLSLENLDLRHRAMDDPRGFLDDHGCNLILDEVQRAPSLFSYLQERVDRENAAPASYVLTGSQQFLLMEKITQSLAGRIVTFNLYPLTVNELYSARPDTGMDSIFSVKTGYIKDGGAIDIFTVLFTGLFPRIHDRNLDPGKWIENYILTYVERDIRTLVNVENLKTFESFIKLCASMSANLVNYTTISEAVGVSQPTVKKWLSLLETSGIVFLLPPYYRNFKKRIVKTPKLYFTDTGLLCFLLSIRKPEELMAHPLFGNIFETFVIGEFYKRLHHVGVKPPLYFWRDKTGREIDLLVENGPHLLPIEIKSSKTHSPALQSGISAWLGMAGAASDKGIVIYRGDDIVGKKDAVTVVPWWCM